MAQPVLETSRLLLRPFTRADAPEVQRLAGAPEVADTTLNVPHPYEAGMAEDWIGGHADQFAAGDAAVYAVILRDGACLIGCIGLSISKRHRRAELGYWLGVEFWGRGYMTEAAGALVEHGFSLLDLHKIEASHLARNPASGRVMEKIGMVREGLLRRHILKNGVFEDLAVYGLVKAEEGQAR